MSLLDALLLDPAPFEIWIAARTDGLKGSGTASDPYDGSTAARFDERMSEAPANSRIHLGPGTFLTNGHAVGGSTGWQLKAGMKIAGSGMEVTKLQLTGHSAANYFYVAGHDISAGVTADFCEISDLTMDCALGSAGAAAACGGVRLMGNHARIHRVRVVNWGSKDAAKPVSALSCISALPDAGVLEIAHCGIDGCVVVNPHASNAAACTAIKIGAPDGSSFTKEGHGKAPYIRNCFVDCGVAAPNPDPATGKFRGLSMGWCRGGAVEGNHVHNADIGGSYQDLGSVRDLIVRNNFYKNVGRGPYLKLGQLGATLLSSNASLSVSNGVATVSGGGLNVGTLAVGDRVSVVSTSPGTFTGIHRITGVQSSPSAQFTFLTNVAGSATVTSVKRVLSASRAIIEGNVIELAQVSGAIAVAVADNNGGGTYAEPPEYAHGDVIIRNN